MELDLADGTTVVRGVSEARFEFEGRSRTSPVLLGEPDDEPLLGAVTLETLGLVLNPLRRKLEPIRAMLAKLGR
jgi:predicted aspartyl protease